MWSIVRYDGGRQSSTLGELLQHKPSEGGVIFNLFTLAPASEAVMRIYRGPNTSNKWKVTDTKNPKSYIRNWRPGTTIQFDGTINKSGGRHSDVGVQLDEDDVIALQISLIKHYRESVKEGEKSQKRVAELELVLLKISRLVSFRKDRAPSTEELLEAVEEIADHFWISFDGAERFRSRFRWLKWKSL